ncbi:MAG TPA: sortase [Patescibacteria group bacterium]|nr:sortase [Patescibacteria group bacterium]
MPSSKSAKASKHPQRKATLADLLTRTGIVLIAFALTLSAVTMWPVILEELGYNARQIALPLKNPEITPIDTDFGVVIPKLGANAKVMANVDPYNSREYQVALTKGVAHAKGTGTPGVHGNIFLFSHSSVNFYEASRYNSVFYLLTKLEAGDDIEVYYQGTKYVYTVIDKKTVLPTAVEYLKPLGAGRETLTLMTCWPPGTTYKRLLIIAERNQTD